MKKFLRIIKFFFTYLIFICLVAALYQYLYCPVYIFENPRPFSGNKIFNPYQNLDSTCWKKGNFHLHSNSWGGLTSGKKNSEIMVDSIYKFLNYDIIGISDYQRINYFRKDQKDFVPIYEQGFLPPKNHRLVMGATKVCWIDFMFPYTKHNAQYLINRIKEEPASVIAIAHPRRRNAYSLTDMNFVSGYDCIEAFNHLWYSIGHWDAALSSGHIAYLLSDDDNHDITNPYLVGNCCTFVNVCELKTTSILAALKSGHTFAGEIYMHDSDKFADKRAYALTLPKLQSVTVQNNQLSVKINQTAASCKFIGQNGQIKKIVKDAEDAMYDIKDDDSYIRTEIHFPDRTVYYLNPVFRYSGEKPENPKVFLNEKKTMMHRILFYISLITVFSVFIFYSRFKKQR